MFIPSITFIKSSRVPTFICRIYEFWSKIFLETLKNSSTLCNKHGYPKAKMASADSKTPSLTIIWSILILFVNFTLGIPTFIHRILQFWSKFFLETLKNSSNLCNKLGYLSPSQNGISWLLNTFFDHDMINLNILCPFNLVDTYFYS